MQYNMTMTNHICNIKFNLHSRIIYVAFFVWVCIDFLQKPSFPTYLHEWGKKACAKWLRFMWDSREYFIHPIPGFYIFFRHSKFDESEATV